MEITIKELAQAANSSHETMRRFIKNHQIPVRRASARNPIGFLTMVEVSSIEDLVAQFRKAHPGVRGEGANDMSGNGHKPRKRRPDQIKADVQKLLAKDDEFFAIGHLAQLLGMTPQGVHSHVESRSMKRTVVAGRDHISREDATKVLDYYLAKMEPKPEAPKPVTKMTGVNTGDFDVRLYNLVNDRLNHIEKKVENIACDIDTAQMDRIEAMLKKLTDALG